MDFRSLDAAMNDRESQSEADSADGWSGDLGQKGITRRASRIGQRLGRIGQKLRTCSPVISLL